jgi:hypothetical protein
LDAEDILKLAAEQQEKDKKVKLQPMALKKKKVEDSVKSSGGKKRKIIKAPVKKDSGKQLDRTTTDEVIPSRK